MLRTILLLALPAVALAVPITTSHQGRLLDSTGTPIDSERSVTINLTSPQGTWTSTTNTPFSDGYYALALGSDSNPLDHALLTDAELTITIDGTAFDLGSLTTVPQAASALSLPDGTVVNLGDSSSVDGDRIVTLPELEAVSAAQLTAEELTQACGGATYTATCADWESMGWVSRDACMTDGRWHVIYANNGTGGLLTVDSASFNLTEARDVIVNHGVDTKVRLDAAAWDETQVFPCAAAGQFQGSLKCSSGRVALHCGMGTLSCNETWSIIEMSSGGTIWAWESMDGDPSIDDSESGQNKVTSMQWWIRY